MLNSTKVTIFLIDVCIKKPYSTCSESTDLGWETSVLLFISYIETIELYSCFPVLHLHG